MNDSAPSAADRPVPGWVAALAARARAMDGAPPFSDGALVEYRTGARELVAIDEAAVALSGSGETEFVVDPDVRGRGLGTRLLETLLGSTADPLLFWAHGDHPAARALAASHGLRPVRELLHLEAVLPEAVPPESPSPSAFSPESGVSRGSGADVGLRLGGFRVGVDEDEWVDLNHRIFGRHAEQGSITRVGLEQLEAEPWFDAEDFLLLRDGGAMIGYCWVKIEEDLGEIYVVGVSPDRQGEKLGGRLFEAGLARMRERGIRRAHLYVEGDNEQALPLYYSHGFERASIDIQYTSVGR